MRKSADDKKPHREFSLDAPEHGDWKLATSINEPELTGKAGYTRTSRSRHEELRATARQEGTYIKYKMEHKENLYGDGDLSGFFQIEYPTKSTKTFKAAREADMICEAINSAAQISLDTLAAHDGTPLDGDKRHREELIISSGTIPVGEL